MCTCSLACPSPAQKMRAPVEAFLQSVSCRPAADVGAQEGAEEASGKHLYMHVSCCPACHVRMRLVPCFMFLRPVQRLRDQVRAWASDPTIHSVQLLEDARHAIEYDMVRTALVLLRSMFYLMHGARLLFVVQWHIPCPLHAFSGFMHAFLHFLPCKQSCSKFQSHVRSLSPVTRSLKCLSQRLRLCRSASRSWRRRSS